MQINLQLRNYVRVIESKYGATPLDVGDSQSRFSPANENLEVLSGGFYGILYGGRSIETAVYEALVRDQFDMEPRRILYGEDYSHSSAVCFSCHESRPLSLLDLTKGKATCYGVPTDVIRSSQHTEGQLFSQFVFDHMPGIDGFLYSSRFSEDDCVALYHERSIPKITEQSTLKLEKNMLSVPMLSKNILVK